MRTDNREPLGVPGDAEWHLVPCGRGRDRSSSDPGRVLPDGDEFLGGPSMGPSKVSGFRPGRDMAMRKPWSAMGFAWPDERPSINTTYARGEQVSRPMGQDVRNSVPPEGTRRAFMPCRAATRGCPGRAKGTPTEGRVPRWTLSPILRLAAGSPGVLPVRAAWLPTVLCEMLPEVLSGGLGVGRVAPLDLVESG